MLYSSRAAGWGAFSGMVNENQRHPTTNSTIGRCLPPSPYGACVLFPRAENCVSTMLASAVDRWAVPTEGERERERKREAVLYGLGGPDKLWVESSWFANTSAYALKLCAWRVQLPRGFPFKSFSGPSNGNVESWNDIHRYANEQSVKRWRQSANHYIDVTVCCN